MKRLSLFLASALALLSASITQAAGVDIQHPYARATPPNAPTSAIFMTVANQTDTEKRIISASTPAAGKVELHTHVKEGDVMKMRQIDFISLPARSKTDLKPGGLHIMLFDLQQEFNPGEQIQVTINFADGQSQTFTAKIKKVMAGMMKHKH